MAEAVLHAPVAAELAAEVLRAAPAAELEAIAADLERKSARFRSLLADGRAAACGREELRTVLRSVFSARRQADAILDAAGAPRLAEAVALLLEDGEPLEARFARLERLLAGFPGAAFELPSELLHFTDPERWWLWTRWVWDPATRSGALRLVTVEGLPGGGSRTETYLQVGRALAFVAETGRAAGFPVPGPFGTDTLLACMYGVYAYTVLGLRMTREFTRVLPRLPELARRLLGVHRLEG